MRVLFLGMMSIAISVVSTSSLSAAEIKTPRAPGSPPAAPGVAKPAPAPAADKKTETAVFAGGCFWCTEFAFEQLAGVIDVESGYCGGTKATANYERVHRGTTAHAEAIRVTYDPEKITYDKLLDVFFDSHDPTQVNRQGNDEGRQYRSAIFFANEDQKKQADAKIEVLNAKRVHKKKIATKLEPLTEFFPAEAYHQDFARRNPLAPYIQHHAVPNGLQVRSKHPELMRKED